MNTSRDLRDLVGSRKAGDTVTLKVRHGDAQKSLSLTLGTRDGAGWMGVQLYSDGPRFGDGLRSDARARPVPQRGAGGGRGGGQPR